MNDLAVDGDPIYERRHSVMNVTALPGLTGRPPKTTEGRRECEEKGCGTRLSRYNDGETCWQHSQAKPFRNRAAYKTSGGHHDEGS